MGRHPFLMTSWFEKANTMLDSEWPFLNPHYLLCWKPWWYLAASWQNGLSLDYISSAVFFENFHLPTPHVCYARMKKGRKFTGKQVQKIINIRRKEYNENAATQLGCNNDLLPYLPCFRHVLANDKVGNWKGRKKEQKMKTAGKRRRKEEIRSNLQNRCWELRPIAIDKNKRKGTRNYHF